MRSPHHLIPVFLFALTPFPAFAANTTIQENVSGTVPFINAGKSADGTTSSTALGLQVNGTEMMRVTATGSVGIGTTTPVVALDINGLIRPQAAVVGNSCSIIGTQAYNSSTGAPLFCSNSLVWTYAGTATSSAIKAWAKIAISGGVATLVSSYNISGVTRSAAGNYTLTFASALTDANYAVSGMIGGAIVGNYAQGLSTVSQTKTSLQITTWNAGGTYEFPLFFIQVTGN